MEERARSPPNSAPTRVSPYLATTDDSIYDLRPTEEVLLHYQLTHSILIPMNMVTRLVLQIPFRKP